MSEKKKAGVSQWWFSATFFPGQCAKILVSHHSVSHVQLKQKGAAEMREGDNRKATNKETEKIIPKSVIP